MSVDQHPVPRFEAVTEPHQQTHPDPDLLLAAPPRPGGFLEDPRAGAPPPPDAPATSQTAMSKDESSGCAHCATVREPDWPFCGTAVKDLPEAEPADPC